MIERDPTIITSDDGPDAPCIEIVIDDQGDVYIGTRLTGEKVAANATRLCGPGGGCRMEHTRLAVLLLDAVTRNDHADIVQFAVLLLNTKGVEHDAARLLAAGWK